MILKLYIFLLFYFSIAEFKSNSKLPSSSGRLSFSNKLKLPKDFDTLMVFLTCLFLLLFFFFSFFLLLLLSVSVEFFLSVLSSQLIDNFSDLAEGLR